MHTLNYLLLIEGVFKIPVVQVMLVLDGNVLMIPELMLSL